MRPECYVKAAAAIGRRGAALAARAALALLLALPALAAAQPAAPSLPAGIYSATSVKDAIALLGAGEAAASGRLLVDVPDIHTAKLPVPVRLRSELPNTDAMVLLVERAPRPVAAAFAMRPMQQPEVVFQLPFARTSPVRLLVRSDGKWYSVTRTVRMAVDAWK
jgi:predicted secreted protein